MFSFFLAGTRALGEKSNQLRDLEVLATELNSVSTLQHGKLLLRQLIEADEIAQRSEFVSYLRGTSHQHWLEQAEMLISMKDGFSRKKAKSIPARVPGLFRVLWEKMNTRGAQLSGHNIESFHKLRLTTKQMRYGLELFRYSDPRPQMLLTSLKAVQSDLGILNDTENAIRLVQQRPNDDRPSVSNLFLRTQTDKRDRLLVQLPGQWQKFLESDFRHTFEQFLEDLAEARLDL